MTSASSTEGFTLAEALTVLALIGILALAAVPVLGSRDATTLDMGAVEVGNMLRFAVNEASRTGRYVLVDASIPGRLAIIKSDASGANLGTVSDPLNKRALELDASVPPWAGIAIAASFFHGGTAYQQLLIGPALQLQVFDAGTIRGPLQAGSGIALTLGSVRTTVEIAELTGRVRIP